MDLLDQELTLELTMSLYQKGTKLQDIWTSDQFKNYFYIIIYVIIYLKMMIFFFSLLYFLKLVYQII